MPPPLPPSESNAAIITAGDNTTAFTEPKSVAAALVALHCTTRRPGLRRASGLDATLSTARRGSSLSARRTTSPVPGQHATASCRSSPPPPSLPPHRRQPILLPLLVPPSIRPECHLPCTQHRSSSGRGTPPSFTSAMPTAFTDRSSLELWALPLRLCACTG